MRKNSNWKEEISISSNPIKIVHRYRVHRQSKEKTEWQEISKKETQVGISVVFKSSSPFWHWQLFLYGTVTCLETDFEGWPWASLAVIDMLNFALVYYLSSVVLV